MGKKINISSQQVRLGAIAGSIATATGLAVYAGLTGDFVTPFAATAAGLGTAAIGGVAYEINHARKNAPAKAPSKAPAKAPAKAAAKAPAVAKGKSGKSQSSYVESYRAEESAASQQMVR
ncbi:MAG: hypothetical protein MK137_06150 [Rickettsiales bacterium]|nr:hypothetical protein [Rickettsiales bacterium]